MEALKRRRPDGDATELGPLATADAVRTSKHDVEATIEAGARVLTGGKPLNGPGTSTRLPYSPTSPRTRRHIAKNCSARSPACSASTDIDDAIQLANDSRFGLGASAWTNDPAERDRFANEIEAGMVFINKMVVSDPRMPFGGVKWSGHGRELAASTEYESLRNQNRLG